MSQYVEVSNADRDLTQPTWPRWRSGPSVGLCLIIESESNPVLESILGDAGFRTDSSDFRDDAVARMALSEPDFVILDLGARDVNGIAACRAIRKGHETPILVLSDSNGDDIVDILRAGADAYLRKPIRPHELVARVRAILRRRPTIVRTGPADRVQSIRVDRAGRLATVAGRPLELSIREFEVLSTLVADCGTRVTRREALLSLDESPDALDTVIRRVRSLLEAEEGWRRLVSVRGVGFKLMTSPIDI